MGIREAMGVPESDFEPGVAGWRMRCAYPPYGAGNRLDEYIAPRAVIAEAAARAPRVDAGRFRADVDAVIDQSVDG